MRLSRDNLPMDHQTMMSMALPLCACAFRDDKPMTMEEMLLRAVAMGGNSLFLSLRIFLTAVTHAGTILPVNFVVDGDDHFRFYRGDQISGRIKPIDERLTGAPMLNLSCPAATWRKLEADLYAIDITHLLRLVAAYDDDDEREHSILRRAGPNPTHEGYMLPPPSLLIEGVPLLRLDETKMDLITEYAYYRRLGGLVRF